MKAVIQRVLNASCMVDGRITGEIGKGLLIYFSVDKDDDLSILPRFLEKIVRLRCFEDENGKMNRSVMESGASVLFISQFTLAGDVYKGNRPGFDNAAPADRALRYYEKAVETLRGMGYHVECGRFGAHMKVSYVNDGPETFILDSRRLVHKRTNNPV